MNRIRHVRRVSTDTQRLDPRKPMPHIICPEARPHMDMDYRNAKLPALLTGMAIGSAVTAAIATLIP